MRGLARDPSAILGLIVIGGAILIAVLAPALSPADPVKNSLIDRLTPPMWNAGGSARHPLGTDTLGRDVASRLLYGARVSLIVGLAAVVTPALGVVLGLLSGYYRASRTMRSCVWATCSSRSPSSLAVAVLAVLGASLANVILSSA